MVSQDYLFMTLLLITLSWPRSSGKAATRGDITERDQRNRPLLERTAKTRDALRRQVMIVQVKGGYQVLSSKGRNLGGPYKTKAEALKRLRQVEFFKRRHQG